MILSFCRKEKIIEYLSTVFPEEEKMKYTLGSLLMDDSTFCKICQAETDQKAIELVEKIIKNKI